MDIPELPRFDRTPFEKCFKIGIAKALKQEGLLTDMQLYALISKINDQNTCTSKNTMV